VVSGASHVTIRENYISSPHSVGISIGDEHDNHALSTTHSDYAQIINNQIVGNWLEGIWATGISYATISGNEILNNHSYAGIYHNHQSAGITVISWPENAPSSFNWIIGNIITSNTGHELAGVYFAPNQGSNTVSYNDLSQNVVGGIVDQSGTATNIDVSNKTTADGTELTYAPPLADAGASDAVAAGSAVGLDGSATHLMAGTGDISYRWSQIYGDAVTIEDANSAHAVFEAPGSSQTELVGFRLTVWNANGSTTDDVYFAIDPSQHAAAIGADPLKLNSLPDDPVFHGSAGDDMIQDYAGGKQIFGEGGNDWITAGRDADHIDGGLGIDTVTYKDSDAGVLVDLDLTGPQASAGWANGDVLLHVESLVGSKFSDVLGGNAENNNIDGGIGNDILIGGAGNDRLIGGADGDLMIGGTGDDVYYVDHADDAVIEQSNQGSDSVRASVSVDHLADNVERLVLTGTAAINGAGNDLDNQVFGNDAANILDGGNGNDQLSGYAGQDLLVGGAGADRLDGGAGSDVLIGGAGNDTFWFKQGDANGDTIADFNANGEWDGQHGDRVFLQGYGPDAALSQGANDTWEIDYAGGHDTITVHGIVHASDFHLV
jgi:Ca2+-binding RTX toxin-like protein